MQNPHGPPCADDALQMLSSKMGSKRQHLCPCLQRGHPRRRRPQPCQAHTWDGDAEMPLSHPSLGEIRRGAQGIGTAGKEESETHAAALPSGRDKNQQRCKKRKTTTTTKNPSNLTSGAGGVICFENHISFSLSVSRFPFYLLILEKKKWLSKISLICTEISFLFFL